MKRHYLRFFYEKLTVKNNRIFEVIPTLIFATLRDNSQVIQKKLVLKTWDSYRKQDWVNEIEYPEFTIKEVNRFLSF